MTYDEAKVYAWQAFQSRQPSLEDVIHAIRNAVNAQTAKLERELKETDLLLEAKLSRKTADVPYSRKMDRALPEDLPEWLRDFTDRERDEIKFAQMYAVTFAHGTDGHSRLILIAKLADKLNTSELMRQDPQVIFEQEYRDLEAIRQLFAMEVPVMEADMPSALTLARRYKEMMSGRKD